MERDRATRFVASMQWIMLYGIGLASHLINMDGFSQLPSDPAFSVKGTT